MSVSSIGIQMILPKTGTSPKSPPPPSGDRPDAVTTTAVTMEDAVKRPPPSPGTGKVIDKVA